MRKLIVFLMLAISIPLIETGCTTPPAQRQIAVQTIAAIGITARAALDQSARMLGRGDLTLADWGKIASYYDNVFQPAYTLAAQAVRYDISKEATPELVGLGAQFSYLVQQLTTKLTFP
jgi:hypothetical protein